MTNRFDAYRHTYRTEVERSIAFVGQSLDFFTNAKARALIAVTERTLGDPAQVRALDIGCGPGETDRLLESFGDLHGVDISAELIEAARARNPHVTYRHYDGRALPYADAFFDFAFAICVLHHVSPVDRTDFMVEAARVVRPGGVIAVIEHNPWNPLTRLAVARCEFDEDAVLLRKKEAIDLLERAGLRLITQRFILFFPWRLPFLDALERGLRRLPLGAQYVVAGQRPHSDLGS